MSGLVWLFIPEFLKRFDSVFQ